MHIGENLVKEKTVGKKLNVIFVKTSKKINLLK